MGIQQRFCSNHPQRPAIGVCVMTSKPICGECSTRYEGVNYSREGLEILQKQRRAVEAGTPSRKKWVLAALLWAISPAMLYLMYLGFVMTSGLLATMLHGEL